MNTTPFIIVFLLITVAASAVSNARKRSGDRKTTKTGHYPVQPPNDAAPDTKEPRPTAADTRHTVRHPVRTPADNGSLNAVTGEGFNLYDEEHITDIADTDICENSDDGQAFEPDEIVRGLIMSEILNRKIRT